MGKTINEFIAQERKKLNLTYEELAKKSGIQFAQIYKIETGSVKKPHVDTLYKLALALNLNFEKVLISATHISEEIPETLGDFIRRARLLENLTREQLAEKSNLNRETLQNIELNKSIPNVHSLEAIAGALTTVKLEELLSRRERRKTA